MARIILLFDDFTQGELGVAEISRKLEMAPSKVSRMLKTFEDYKFFEQDTGTGKYRLGSLFLELGLAYTYHLPIRKIIRPHIEYMAREFKMTASWGIISKNRVIVLDRIHMINLDMLTHRIGNNLPIFTTSIGKVILADQSEEKLDQILKSIKLIKYTKETVVDPKLIKRNLQVVREEGYAYDWAETAENTICIAAPIRNEKGEVIAAIALTDVIPNSSPDHMLEQVPILKERAMFISRQLGYRMDIFEGEV